MSIMAIDSFAYFDHTGSAAGLEVRGETQDAFFSKPPDAPSPAFELKSWKFGSKNKTTIGSATGGAGGGKAEFDEFTITKAVDSASPNFFRNCVTGTHYKYVYLALRKAGPDPKKTGGPYLLYRFGTVFTTSVAWTHGDEPTEDIAFVYGDLQIKYFPQDSTGKLSTTAKIQQWSVLTNSADVPA
jgi:type VI secretion system secreted protein Hcp